MATYKSNFDKWDVGVAIGRTNPTPLDSTEVQSFADLTEYAKIVDVNTAFNELATALGGL